MWLCEEIVDVAQLVEETELAKNKSLGEEFVKKCLKIGLNSSTGELLRVLKVFCRKCLPLGSTTETAVVFQMMISHSQFINVILGDSQAKST